MRTAVVLVLLGACAVDDRRPDVVEVVEAGTPSPDVVAEAGAGPDTPPEEDDAGTTSLDGSVGEGCAADAVDCGGVCRQPGSCCTDEECGGPGVGTCSSSGACSCQNAAFGARCTGRFVGLGVVGVLDSDSEATAVSGDGRVVVGWSGLAGEPPSATAARWEWEINAARDLGTLSEVSSDTSLATSVSFDGSVVVGDASAQVFGNESVVGFRWTEATGIVALDYGTLSAFAHAEAVTNDGTIVVGWADNDGGALAGALWRESDGYTLDLISASPDPFQILASDGTGSLLAGELASPGVPVFFDPAAQGQERFRRLNQGRFTNGAVSGVSADASQLVGTLSGTAVRWINAPVGGAPSIGNPRELGPGQALDVSNGGVVVGRSETGVAVLWTPGDERQELLGVLQAAGAGGLAGWELQSATGISDDGRVIVGAGTRGGRQEAWVLRLPAAL